MKTVYILHGCPSGDEKGMGPKTRTYDKHWMPWLKEELSSRGINVVIPLMPDPWIPNYEKFTSIFEKYDISEEDILIGHSCGTTFLLEWMGNSKQKIEKLILVAPWKITDKEDESHRAFYEQPIDKTIKDRVKEVIIFTSDDEHENGKKSVKIVTEAIGGKVIELEGMGHYTFGDMGTEEFPELLEEIIETSE